MTLMNQLGLALPYGRELTPEDLARIPWRDASFELLDGMLVVRGGRPFTFADLEALPHDDGHRYETIDGVLYVSAAPRPVHQDAVANLFRILDASVTPQLVVRFAPLAFLADELSTLEPDLMVLRRDAFTDAGVGAVELLVEVLSPSTTTYDRRQKKRKYEQSGTPHYWIVDPQAPSIEVHELHDGTYAEVVRASDSETLHVERPFPVTLRPVDLLRR